MSEFNAIYFMNIPKYMFKISISLLLSVIFLSLFVFIYSYVGVQVRCDDLATDYHWEPNQTRSNMTEGFTWFGTYNT